MLVLEYFQNNVLRTTFGEYIILLQEFSKYKQKRIHLSRVETLTICIKAAEK